MPLGQAAETLALYGLARAWPAFPGYTPGLAGDAIALVTRKALWRHLGCGVAPGRYAPCQYCLGFPRVCRGHALVHLGSTMGEALGTSGLATSQYEVAHPAAAGIVRLRSSHEPQFGSHQAPQMSPYRELSCADSR